MVHNLTTKKKVVLTSRKVTSIIGKAIGLMFSKKKQEGLIFVNAYDQYVPLHMFFVFYAIDVIYCNKDKHIVDMKQNFLPFTLFHPQCKARYILELPAGSIERSQSKLGHKLKF